MSELQWQGPCVGKSQRVPASVFVAAYIARLGGDALETQAAAQDRDVDVERNPVSVLFSTVPLFVCFCSVLFLFFTMVGCFVGADAFLDVYDVGTLDFFI